MGSDSFANLAIETTRCDGDTSDCSSYPSTPLTAFVDEDNTAGEGALPVFKLRSGSYESIGARRTLEDAHSACDDVTQLTHPGLRGYYAVFDGHGGRGAAEFANERLLAAMLGDNSLQSDVSATLASAFRTTDVAFRTQHPEDSSGTTALAALILGDGSLFVANAGDCRAILSREGRCHILSTDHKPCAPAELARIRAAGGDVCGGYLNGSLGVSRAIGDWCNFDGAPVKTLLDDGSMAGPLISAPDVIEVRLQSGDEFILLACDGLWDCFSNDNAITFARKALREHNDPARCARELVHEALRMGSTDNVTAVVVCLSSRKPPGPPPRVSSEGGLRHSLSRAALEKLSSTTSLVQLAEAA